MIARPTLRLGVLPAIAVAFLGVLAWGAPRADASVFHSGSSADGSRVFFSTAEKILPGADTDNALDVYQRFGATTSLVSFGPFGGNGPFDAIYGGASADGARVYFTTAESLVAADTDASRDVYERTAGTTTLASQSAGAPVNLNADFQTLSADGSRVVFSTAEPLTPADTDAASDVYVRVAGTTTLLSPGSAAEGAVFRAASADATRVFFVTDESLTAGDTDSSLDIYENASGTVSLVSGRPAGGGTEVDASFGTVSADGTHVLFETTEALVPGDTDSASDVYDRTGGATVLRSISDTAGGGDFAASFVGMSSDGSHAYFSTSEQLTPEDTDAQPDIYDTGGSTVLATTGPAGGNGDFSPEFDGSSASGDRVFFTTAEALTTGDTDASQDIYSRSASGTELISTGPDDGAETDAFFAASSEDGTRVVFTTTEPLLAEDTDSFRDVYERAGTTTTLLSTGPHETNGPYDAFLGGASPDLSVAFVVTGEHLTDQDTDGGGVSDVFARSTSGIVLISGGSQTVDAPDPPAILSSQPGSPSADETPTLFGSAPAGSLVRLYATGNCSGNPIGAASAATFSTTGIEITVNPNTTTAIRATATDTNGNTSACSSTAFTYVEDSTAPAAPSITGTDPASPANFNSPKVRGAAEAGSTVRLYLSADCSGGPVAVAGASQFTTPGLTISVADNTTTVLSATATDAAGNTSACSVASSYVEDSMAVATPVLSSTSPPSPADDNTVSIRGSAAANSTVRIYDTANCSGAAEATGGAAELAGAGITVQVPDNSTTSFRAVASTPAGNVSACSAPIAYVEDSLAPDAPALELGSRARSNDNRVVLRGRAAAGALVYVFRGDDCQGTAVTAGTAEQLSGAGLVVPVPDNTSAEFHAVAVDAARNSSVCSSPGLIYVEDSRAPNTRITFGPAFKTRDRSPTFRFIDETGDERTRFQCKLDRKRFRPCGSPKTFKGLRPGRHAIRVRAIDAAGNREKRAVVRKFKVVR